MNFITREILRLNSPELNSRSLGLGKIFEVNNTYRPKPKISLNSRKCYKWQFNSGYDRQSCKIFINDWMPLL